MGLYAVSLHVSYVLREGSERTVYKNLKFCRQSWKLSSGVLLLLLFGIGCRVELSATKTPATTVGTTVFAAAVGRPPSEAIDVVFVPDNDYGDMSVVASRQDFLDDVSGMINDGFRKNQALVFNFLAINFWFMTATGDVQPGSGICPSVTWPDLTDAAFAEVIVLLHPNDLRDCASGNKVTSEPDSFRTVVHEASHAAFGLPDEYCCDGGYWAVQPVLYTSELACTSDAANASWRDCQSFTSSGGTTWWRSEDTDCDMMACGGPAGDWQRVLEYGRADWVVVEGVLGGLPGATVATSSVFAPDEWP